jgi:hypothetical protein
LTSRIPARERDAIGDEIIAIAERTRKKYKLTIPETKQEICSIVRDVSL